MSDDVEAMELAAQECVFSAAIAVLSGGKPLEDSVLEVVRSSMTEERLPADLIEALLARARSGSVAEDVPIVAGMDREQAALFAASIILFALRGVPTGDPLEVARRIVSPYGVTTGFVEAFARALASVPDARRSSDTARSLQLLLDPPEWLLSALRAFQAGTGKAPPHRRSVGHVSPQTIQHPLDREASEALRNVAGMEDLVAVVVKHSYEKLERVNNIGGRVRVGPQQFPGLWEIFLGCVRRAGIHPIPELFLENGSINAYTFGVDRPYVVLHSGCITLLSRSELEFVIGHELGHIRFQHVLNHMLGRLLPMLASQLPFGQIAAAGIDLALYNWQRKAEFSADRFGLLVAQDLDAALRLMVKLSGVPAALYRSVNVDAFLAQYEDYKALDSDLAGVVAKFVRSAWNSHPWTVERGVELRRWVQEGEYERILAAGAPGLPGIGQAPRLLAADTRPYACPVCHQVVPATEIACGACKSPVTERDRHRRCARCGATGRSTLKFCESCGVRHEPASGEGG